MPFTFALNGNTYTSDPTNVVVPDGYRFIGYGYITALANLSQDIVAVMTQQVAAAAGQVTLAGAQANAAATSAASALSAPGTTATSATALTVGFGAKALTIQANKALVVGASVKIADTATPTNWMHGDITSYNSVSGALTVNVTTVNGASTVANWTISLSGPAVQNAISRSPRTVNAVLTGGDKATFVDITGGTFSQTLTAAATLGNGWFCYVGNSGAGFVTLDPNAAETVTVHGQALPTWVLWPNESGLLVCNGAGFNYYQITKGEITQTVGVAVASVSFSTGLAYRRRLSLTIEDVSSSGTVLPALKINNTVVSQKIGFLNNAGSVQSGTNGGFLIGGGADIKAAAVGDERVNAQALITPGLVNTTVTLMSKHTASAAGIQVESVMANWLGVTEATITSIDIVPASTNIATGTFILREL
jgi:hypothetical protein